MENVVLVDEFDVELGIMEKMEAHRKGVLHRAFSIFIFNSNNELMLQQRALEKYHSGGLWTNTCCSHPRKGELLIDAAHRRLVEEMGFDCDLHKAFDFIYKATSDNGLIEHEYDHVFMGVFDGSPTIVPDEVMRYKYISIPALVVDVAINPESYTEWFKICLAEVVQTQKCQVETVSLLI